MFACARAAGMWGADEMEQARCDMVVGCAEDLLQAVAKSNQGSDEEKVKRPYIARRPYINGKTSIHCKTSIYKW